MKKIIYNPILLLILAIFTTAFIPGIFYAVNYYKINKRKLFIFYIIVTGVITSISLITLIFDNDSSMMKMIRSINSFYGLWFFMDFYKKYKTVKGKTFLFECYLIPIAISSISSIILGITLSLINIDYAKINYFYRLCGFFL